MKAFLEYAFIFDPAETWAHLYEFEGDLAKFFDEHGFEAEVLQTVSEQSGRRVFVIKKKETMIPTEESTEEEPETSKVSTSIKRLKAIGRDRDSKGKFRKKHNG